MKYLVFVCLWLCAACKSTVRAPVSDLHAITDGRVTLGVVASENEEGLQVYRLLLCKRFSVYDAATFADRTKCLPAMLDGDGREVVIFHNSLRRSFAAKYGNYAKIVAGVALVAGAVYGVHRWFAKGSKYIDNFASRADEALQIKKSELQEAYDKEIARIKEDLDELKLSTDEADRIEQEMQEAFNEADRDALEKVLARIESIDKELGEGLRSRLTVHFYDGLAVKSGFTEGTIITPQRINTELLDDFAKRVEKSDEVFAERLKWEKFAPKAIKDSDLYYFGNLYRDATQMFNREIREKLTRVANRDPSLIVNELSHTERVIVFMRVRKADTFAHVAKLRQYEMEKELLSQLSEGRLSVADMKKNLQKLTANDSLAVESHIARMKKLFDRGDKSYTNITNASVGARSGSLWKLDDLDKAKKLSADKAKKLLADIDEEESLLGQPLPSIEKIHKIAAHREAIRMYEMEGFSLKSALSEVDRKISRGYDRLYGSETSPFSMPNVHDDYIEFKFWHEIMKRKPTNTSELRLQSLKKEIEIFEANLQANTSEVEASEGLLQMGRDAVESNKKLLTEHRDNTVQRLKEAVQAIEDGNTARVQELKQAAEKERQAWGLSGLAAGLGATAMLTSLDKSIWGHGEKQLGEYWSQIFSDKESFADAASVKDMPAVLNKLAEVFGHRVNAAALQLTQ